MTKKLKRIKKIWSEAFWQKEAKRIELAYWDVIKTKLPNVKPPRGKAQSTEHRIEAFVRSLSRKTKIGNLHVGLTSSDLEDNIRIKRIEESCKVFSDVIASFNGLLIQKCVKHVDKKIIAYTHLVPAGTTRLLNRMAPQIEILTTTPSPRIIYKGIKGSIGDKNIQRILGVDHSKLNEVFDGCRIQSHSSQTVSHITEYSVASWLVLHVATLTKISNDFRLMFALEQSHHTHNDIGSTAIAGKKPNPWRFEKFSSNAVTIFNFPAEIANILANCLLERTLTNQSVLNRLFRDNFTLAISLIEELMEALKTTHIVDQTEQCKDPKFHSEESMVKLIKNGMPREAAHKEINTNYGKK